MLDILKELFKTIEGVVVYVIGALVVFCGYNLYSLSMGTVTWEYFIGWLAVVVLVGGGLLALKKKGFIAAPFIAIAVITFITITVRHRVPGVAAYIASSSDEANRNALLAAAQASEGHEFQCDRTTPNIPLFDFPEGKKRSIAWVLSEKGRYVCFTRPGGNHLTGAVRVLVDDELAKKIREQEPPAPPPTTSPPPQQLRTPVPDLGDRRVPTPFPEVGTRPTRP